MPFKKLRGDGVSEMVLAQYDADILLAMEKHSIDGTYRSFMKNDYRFEIELASKDKKEEFVLNYRCHQINLEKRNHQLRSRKVIGLARLDLNGPPQRNPDGKKIGVNHLHLYREGFALKWAFPIPEDKFSDTNDIEQTCEDFFVYCNIDYDFSVNTQRSLFK